MEQSDLLKLLAATLARLEIPYIVTGSMATIAYGEPRFTIDIDVVVDLPASKIDAILEAFPDPEFYVSRPAVEEAVRRRRQFNIIHPASGLKVDVIVASNSEFDRGRMSRGRWLTIEGKASARFASPEDVILKKMQYFLEGRSEKHLRDIHGVLLAQRQPIDYHYLTGWIDRMGLAEAWDLIQQRFRQVSGDSNESASQGNPG